MTDPHHSHGLLCECGLLIRNSGELEGVIWRWGGCVYNVKRFLNDSVIYHYHPPLPLPIWKSQFWRLNRCSHTLTNSRPLFYLHSKIKNYYFISVYIFFMHCIAYYLNSEDNLYAVHTVHHSEHHNGENNWHITFINKDSFTSNKLFLWNLNKEYVHHI